MSFNISDMHPVASDNSILRSKLNTNRSSSFNIGHVNVQSLVAQHLSKLEEVRNILEGNFLDAFGISESWLKPSIPSNAVSLAGYRIFRNDRVPLRGGGVALFVSSKFKAKVVHKSANSSSLEFIFVEVVMLNTNLLLGVVYRSRGGLETLSEALDLLSPTYSNIFIMGDFNLNLLEPRVLSSTSEFFNRFGCSILDSGGPTHFDSFWNSSSKIDFFVTNNSSLVASPPDKFWCPSISRHAFLFVSLSVPKRVTSVNFQFRDYRGVNIEPHHVDYVSLDRIYGTSDPNVQVEIINSSLLALFDQHVPYSY